MSPEQKASRLSDIVDEIDVARHLVEAGRMATVALTREQSGALSALLHEVSDRLKAISDDVSAEARLAA